jgi:GNAT superfamily N-acetyltransferase
VRRILRHGIGEAAAAYALGRPAGKIAFMKRPSIRLRGPRPGDMGWVVQSHGALYAAEYGYDARFEALVAEIVARFVREFDPRFERCWIAERGKRNVGSVFLVRQSRAIAKLRLLIVAPEARSLGLGRRLVNACLRFARARGYRKVVLWTQSELDAARHIYQRAGFRRVRATRHASFGKPLVGEYWELALRRVGSGD